METEGIFRLSGSSSAVMALKHKLDTSLITADLSDWNALTRDINIDGHAVAGVLKLYLRDLPDPLLSRKLYNFWLAAQDHSSCQDRSEVMFWLVQALPKQNRCLLFRLLQFFQELTAYTGMNKMTTQNLATVLGPNILRQLTDSAAQMVHHAGAINSCALELIRNPALHSHTFEEYLGKLAPDCDGLPPKLKQYICFSLAIFDYQPDDKPESESKVVNGIVTKELSFRAGDVFMIRTLSQLMEDDCRILPDKNSPTDTWWVAEKIGGGCDVRPLGIIPSNYVKVIAKLPHFETSLVMDPTISPSVETSMVSKVSHEASVEQTHSDSSPMETLSEVEHSEPSSLTGHENLVQKSLDNTFCIDVGTQTLENLSLDEPVRNSSDITMWEGKVFLLKKEKSQLLETIKELRLQLTAKSSVVGAHPTMDTRRHPRKIPPPPPRPTSRVISLEKEYEVVSETVLPDVETRKSLAGRPTSLILGSLLGRSPTNDEVSYNRPVSYITEPPTPETPLRHSVHALKSRLPSPPQDAMSLDEDVQSPVANRVCYSSKHSVHSPDSSVVHNNGRPFSLFPVGSLPLAQRSDDEIDQNMFHFPPPPTFSPPLSATDPVAN